MENHMNEQKKSNAVKDNTSPAAEPNLPRNPAGVEASADQTGQQLEMATTAGNEENGNSGNDAHADKAAQLRGQLTQLKSELDTLITDAATLTEAELADAHARLMLKFGSFRVIAKSMAANAGDKLNQGKEITYERVRSHPMQSVAIAASAGMLMGLAMR